MATRYGTSYFVSLAAAVRYYRDVEDNPVGAVARKVTAGEIHIGKPVLKEGETLSVIDAGTRYAVNVQDSHKHKGHENGTHLRHRDGLGCCQ
jgi:hypothetical protein